MKSQTLKNIFFGAMLATMTAQMWGQQCPDWSPKFDQINDSQAMQQLQAQRSQGWPTLDPQRNGGVSYQQQVQGFEQIAQQFQQSLQQSEQTYRQVQAYNTPMPNMNYDECRSLTRGGAALAAACQAANARNGMLAAQGSADLARCRAGMPPGSYASVGSLGSEISAPRGGFGTGHSYDDGASSVASLNVSKRSGMVNKVEKSWQAPAEQQEVQATLASNTNLVDPFAESELKSGGLDSSTASSEPIVAANSQPSFSDNPAAAANRAASTNQWSDPLAQDEHDGESGSAADNIPRSPSPAEVAAAVDSGTANISEVTDVPVAQVSNASSWEQFANPTTQSLAHSSQDGVLRSVSDATAPSPASASYDVDTASLPVASATTSDTQDHSDTLFSLELSGLSKANDAFNDNGASKYVTDQGIKQIGGQAAQEFKVVDDIPATGIFSTDPNVHYNSGAVQTFDSDFDKIGVASVKAVLPGSDYLDAATADYSQWEKKIQNANSYVKARVRSFYYYVTGETDCTKPNFDPECAR